MMSPRNLPFVPSPREPIRLYGFIDGMLAMLCVGVFVAAVVLGLVAVGAA